MLSRNRIQVVLRTVAFWFLAIGTNAAAELESITNEQRRFFEDQVRPLLIDHCYECHSSESEQLEGGLALDSKAGWTQGGDSGSPIVPGKPEMSRLIDAVRYDDPDLQMPPDGKLTANQIATLVRWVEIGAPDPRTARKASAVTTVETFDIEKRRREHWSWQPLRTSIPPETDDTDWPNHDLDRFILRPLEQQGMRPAAPADKRTLIRRVTFNLIGLPPTPEEIDEFLADDSTDAFVAVVDRLLKSPHFGEHWAQHWLDLVRYAETRGHEQDFPIPEAFRYRDYIIRALNQNVPYDQLVVEHVAGDLIDPPRLDPDDRSNQSIQGTGFWHLGEATHSPVDIRGDEADRVHNQIDAFSRTFLGLSMGCTRCHDHKFDAISTRDYYALFGYLQSSSFQLADVSDPERQREVRDRLARIREDHVPRITAAYARLKQWQLKRLPKYLVGARDFIDRSNARGQPSKSADSPPEAAPVEQLTNELSDRVERFARAAGLDPQVLEAFVAHLHAAAADFTDPLYLLTISDASSESTAASEIDVARQETLAELQKRHELSAEAWEKLQVIKSTKAGERNYSEHVRPWTVDDLIEDFSSNDPERWITSGMRFGTRPRQPGEVLLGVSVDRPIQRFLDVCAGESDMLSPKLTGMLRTRTFEITGDTIWYRYRGRGELFLAIDSHRVVNGPLHAVVKQELKGDPNRWQWHGQHVRDYVGHRVHAEFTAQDGFAISRIQFAATEPPEVFRLNPYVRQMLEGDLTGPGATLDQLADRISRLLAQSVQALADDRLQVHDIELLNWMITHERLFETNVSLKADLERHFMAYRAARSMVETRIPKPIQALALLDGSGEDEPVHIRGNHRNPSKMPVPRRILTVLGGDRQTPPNAGSGRLELAQRLVNPDNDLIPRVMVNRIWHHLFGRGIVPTVDDFGAMGQRPSHPDLLDYLAQAFVQQDWSIKQLIRQIVLSSTFRMSSHPNPAYEQLDPTNRWFHRMPIRRLTAESIRDHMLAVSGRLDRQMYGPSVMVHITPFMRGNRSPRGSGPLDGDGRRSIYTEVRRNHLPAMLVAFDRPIPFTALGRRNISNSPAQPLILLNDPFVHQQAKLWAERTLGTQLQNDEQRLYDVYVRAFARPPRSAELNAAFDFLTRQTQQYQVTGEDEPVRMAWFDFCHTLMNAKEFIYIN